MSLARFINRLEGLGCKAEIAEEGLKLEVGEAVALLRLDDEWNEAIDRFYKARQYKFDSERRILTSNRAAEFLVVRLDPGFFYKVEHEFSDAKENTVLISQASKEYLLSYFESDRYERLFERIKDRIERRYYRRNPVQAGRVRQARMLIDDLFFRFHTATYTVKRKPRNKKIEDVAIDPVKACLFSLAYKKDESWELSHEIKSKGLIYPKSDDEDEDESLTIPRASYQDSVVTYYKVAKSSQFPSQAFLSYYHILEFYFLRVSDEELFNAVSAQLNDPDFKCNYANVTKLLAAIKRNDNTSSEKEMLFSVLRKYVSEEEFIDFIREFEEAMGDKIYTKSKDSIFGERFPFKLEKGHAINNASAIIKHIRNALVHSSDKYNREDCFLPLSESEDVVVKYIPVVKFLAEKVIFATAST